MAIDNLQVSSIPDFSRFLERNVQHPPGITRTQTPGMGMEGKEGKASSYILAWAAGVEMGRGLGGRERRRGIGIPFRAFLHAPLPFLRLPGRLYFGIQPLNMLGEHLKTGIW